MNNLKRLFKRLLRLSKRVNNRRARVTLFQALPYHQLYFISKVEVYKSKGLYEVEVTTHKPGELIGEYGLTLDRLTSELRLSLGAKVEIKIIENNLWNI